MHADAPRRVAGAGVHADAAPMQRYMFQLDDAAPLPRPLVPVEEVVKEKLDKPHIAEARVEVKQHLAPEQRLALLRLGAARIPAKT